MKGHVEPRTEYNYREAYRDYIKPYVGAIRLSKRSPVHVQQMQSRLIERGLSARTVYLARRILSRALRKAVQWRMLAENPVGFTDAPRMKKSKQRALSPEETEKFLNAANQDRYAALWHLAVDSGMRPEEYLALRWSDIDWQTCIVTVDRGLVFHRRAGRVFYFSDTKNKYSKKLQTARNPATKSP